MLEVEKTLKLGIRQRIHTQVSQGGLSYTLCRLAGVCNLKTKDSITYKSKGRQITLAFLSLGKILYTGSSYQKL